ncbi:HNH endonuclease signature motif containing protein [Gordonia sp. NPDC003424]
MCHDDPRSPGQLQVAALAAISRRQDTFACQCGTDHPTTDMDSGADAPAPSTELVPATTTLVSIVTDAQTLAGITGGALVPRVEGYGVIDPDLARALAADATWQGLYREAAGTDPHAQGLRKGRPRRAGTIAPNHLIAPGPVLTRSRPPNTADLIPVDATGHGGYTTPPAGALTYQPTDAIRRAILLTDHTCRGPWCDVPAEHCQLDHLVPFDHHNPVAGGWTVPDDLAPLCIPCHQFKHLGIWTPTMCHNRIIRWHNTTTGDVIVTHP